MSWFSRHGDSRGSRFSPNSRQSNSPNAGEVSDADFSYITSEDLAQAAGKSRYRPSRSDAPETVDWDDKNPSRDTDVLVFRHSRVYYPTHFPAQSISNGELKIGAVRQAAAKEIGVNDPKRMRMFFKGRNLKHDERTAREEGLRGDGAGSEILCAVSQATAGKMGPGSEEIGVPRNAERVWSDDSEEEDDAEGGIHSGTITITMEPRKRGGKESKKKKGAYRSSTSAPAYSNTTATGAEFLPIPSHIRGPRPTSAPTTNIPRATTPQTPLGKLELIASKFHAELVPLCIEFLQNPPAEKEKRDFEYKRLSETILIQILLKLDGVETDGNQDARMKRKELVKQVHSMLNKLDEGGCDAPAIDSNKAIDGEPNHKIETTNSGEEFDKDFGGFTISVPSAEQEYEVIQQKGRNRDSKIYRDDYEDVIIVPEQPRPRRRTNVEGIGSSRYPVSADNDTASPASSVAPSIFSVATGPSVITTNTQYSEEEIASVTQQLVDILCKDGSLQLLYKAAIQSETIGAERFCRNFRRLLRIYSKELKEDAGDSLQYLVAQFVQWKARRVAELIKERYTTGKSPPVNTQSSATPLYSQIPSAIEEDSSGEEQSENFQEDNLKTLSPVTDFLTDGVAFENLKTSFEKFVSPPQSRQRRAQTQEGNEPTPSAAACHGKGRYRAMMWFFAMLRFVERPIEPGKQRVRWKCRCGKQLYDDYTELKTGALEDLRKRLENLAASRETPGSSQGHSSTASKGGNQFSALMNSVLSLFSSARKRSSIDPHIPLYNRSAVGSSSTANESMPQPNPLHLLVCMKDGKFGTSLYQEEISGLKNDQDLFKFLHDDYMHRRSKLYPLVSLQAPESIKLVKFNLVSGKFVDVRKHELDCAQRCICLPPPVNVEPEPNAEYRCMPIPPSLCPPLGSELLMHLFSHPECLEDEKQAWILAQFPKKLLGTLARKPDGPVAGWGIHFEEGWNWDRIRMILFIYLVGSLVFGVLWTVRRGDMQGAFGVAGYWVSTATVFLGYIALRH